jgi:hypothetical protein
VPPDNGELLRPVARHTAANRENPEFFCRVAAKCSGDEWIKRILLPADPRSRCLSDVQSQLGRKRLHETPARLVHADFRMPR